MSSLEYLRSEIEHMRGQVGRQRKEILQLQRAGFSTVSAEALLERMLTKIDALCLERDTLRKEHPGHMKGIPVAALPIAERHKPPSIRFHHRNIASHQATPRFFEPVHAVIHLVAAPWVESLQW